MSYPTVEQHILDDNAINQWIKQQVIETRNKDVTKALDDIEFLKELLEKRFDREIKESKTFKTVTNLKAVSF